MKKLLALVLASVLLLGVPVAYGTEYENWDGVAESPTSEITLSITRADSTFVIVIPAEIPIDKTTMTGSMTVTLQKGYQLYSSLRITLEVDANGLNLVHSTDSDMKIPYSLTIDGEAWEGTQRASLIYVDGGTSDTDKTATIEVTVTGVPEGIGDYKDTLTFRVQ